MKTQQAAEREEQQRIKSLVLNYDLRDGEEQDGELAMIPLSRNTNIYKENSGLEKATANTYSRPDKSGNNRSGQRARKLQLSDVDWYGTQTSPHSRHRKLENQLNPTHHLKKASSGTPLGLRAQSTALPNSRAVQERNRNTVKTSSRPGRLTRKEMLSEHALRIAASKRESEK